MQTQIGNFGKKRRREYEMDEPYNPVKRVKLQEFDALNFRNISVAIFPEQASVFTHWNSESSITNSNLLKSQSKQVTPWNEERIQKLKNLIMEKGVEYVDENRQTTSNFLQVTRKQLKDLFSTKHGKKLRDSSNIIYEQKKKERERIE